MEVIFISESFKGRHKELPISDVIKARATTTKIVEDDDYSRYSTVHFEQMINSINKVGGIMYGTDFDAQGTKVASVYKLVAQEKFGIKANVRMAFTKNGYMKIGEFYGKKRLEGLLMADTLNYNVAKQLAENTGIYAGYRTAVILSKVKQLKEKQTVIVKNKGTNTITYLTKAMLSGMPVKEAYKNLLKAYSSGAVEYPRTDADYHLEDRYDVYAHPPLEQIDAYATPIEQDSLPIDKKTVLLALSNERLITPATALYYYEKIDQYYDENLNLKEGKEKEMEILDKVALAMEGLYREELKALHSPRLAMTVRPMPKLSSSSEEAKKEELMEKLRQLQEELEEKARKKRKKEQEADLRKKVEESLEVLEEAVESKKERKILGIKV